MGKCRYDLKKDCHNKNCVGCILEDIKAEIEQYEADCMLHCPDDEVCKDCNIDMFKSIYSIIDKHISEKGR